MRGAGQIAELVAIAEPDVGVIVNVGPVHLELLGSIEAVAATKAELLARPARRTAPRSCPPASRCSSRTCATTSRIVTFGPGGDVDALPEGAERARSPRPTCAATRSPALAAARAIGVEPARRRAASRCRALRGERIALPRRRGRHQRLLQRQPACRCGPPSTTSPRRPTGRRVAVLGDMLELGPDERRFHRELGERARDAGVDLLVTVGDLAAHAGPAFGGEVHARRHGAMTPAALAAGAARSPATPCSSRARAASASRSSPLALEAREALTGRGPDRRDRLAAALRLPLAELHRVHARPPVRPAHPRGGAGRAPRQGGHADDGRDHHLHRDLGAVPDPHELGLARPSACSA